MIMKLAIPHSYSIFSNKKFLISEIIVIFIWLSILSKTDSYYSVYILLGILGVISVSKNYKKKFSVTWLEYFFSFLFSLCVTLSNFSIYDNIAKSENYPHAVLAIFAAILVFLGSFLVFLNLLLFVKSLSTTFKLQKSKLSKSKKIFLCYFGIFLAINLTILFLCCYPGTLTSDSLDEVGQLLSNNYSNHHPFYYTLLIKFFVSIGIDLFNNINIGIALLSVFQITVLSAAFSYAFLTLRQIGVSKKLVTPIVFIAAIMPYNITYSFTVWKDVLFGAFFLIFTVSSYRYFFKLAKYNRLNFALICLSGIIICLFRSNALIAMLASTVAFFIFFKKQHLKLGLILCSIVICSFILKVPTLKALNIRGPDTVESLSIPMQQVTRVLVEKHDELPEEDLLLIGQVADPHQLISAYNPTIHDPVKSVVRLHGNQNYLSEHKVEFAKLYCRLGMKYPKIYIQAWIEQTRGYWNGGYNYWRWSSGISANQHGIESTTILPLLRKAFLSYLNLYESVSFLHPFISIGLFVWLLFISIYLSISKKCATLAFLSVPPLITWATLLIATPVFAEFRYVYFLFTCIPFISIATLASHKTPIKLTKNKKQSHYHNSFIFFHSKHNDKIDKTK